MMQNFRPAELLSRKTNRGLTWTARSGWPNFDRSQWRTRPSRLSRWHWSSISGRKKGALRREIEVACDITNGVADECPVSPPLPLVGFPPRHFHRRILRGRFAVGRPDDDSRASASVTSKGERGTEEERKGGIAAAGRKTVCCGQCQWPCFLRPTFYAGTTGENTRA